MSGPRTQLLTNRLCTNLVPMVFSLNWWGRGGARKIKGKTLETRLAMYALKWKSSTIIFLPYSSHRNEGPPEAFPRSLEERTRKFFWVPIGVLRKQLKIFLINILDHDDTWYKSRKEQTATQWGRKFGQNTFCVKLFLLMPWKFPTIAPECTKKYTQVSTTELFQMVLTS